ncbi:MAG: hypothetical protein WBD36_10910 [Bacteroidota bacterium]
MIDLVQKVFDTRSDPSQISVSQRTMTRLSKIHPATLTERRTKEGPIAWMLIFPTTKRLMDLFLQKKISEKELLRKTPIGTQYDALYLCSALVLPEYRKKRVASKLMVQAIRSIRKDHAVQFLFYWSFSRAGRRLSLSVAKEVGLPIFQRR